MIRVAPRYESFYLFMDDNPGPLAPYDAIVECHYESKETVWLRGFKGKTNLKILKELVGLLREKGVKKIKAHREEGRILPRGLRVDDHWEVELKNLP